MTEIKKIDYLKFLFYKIKLDLSKYNITNSDRNLINKLFEKLIYSNDSLQDLYILSHVDDLKKIGKYFIFISKKIEDNVIRFENLSQNIDADTEFIENEILNYLSNPRLRDNIHVGYEDSYINNEALPEDAYSDKINEQEIEEIEDMEEDKEISNFKKNYLELIQSEPNVDNDIAYALPTTEDIPKEEEIYEEKGSVGESETGNQSIGDIDKDMEDDESSKQNLPEKEDKSDTIKIGSEDIQKEDRIILSEEIQEEINLFEEQEKKNLKQEQINLYGRDEIELKNQAAINAAFLEYEKEIKEKNIYLNSKFDLMIVHLNSRPENKEERNNLIKNIIEASAHLEELSRKMSLEVISNIYQTITFSFEKISDGKYDISESTLNLFKNGLTLVISLIKGDSYLGYKDILKSIENIRNALIEEKEKREFYLKKLKEKKELEEHLSKKYPDNVQRVKITIIKHLIKDTESKFISLDMISGEYQIYEALRSLSSVLNNFKEIVKLSKELGMIKLVQMAEASYIFVKFLQNYRINPITIEIKEIFGYIVYNLKFLVVGKTVEDIDLFISYLNDPVKIFTKAEMKKNK